MVAYFIGITLYVNVCYYVFFTTSRVNRKISGYTKLLIR